LKPSRLATSAIAFSKAFKRIFFRSGEHNFTRGIRNCLNYMSH
jgi:hypothetical protein